MRRGLHLLHLNDEIPLSALWHGSTVSFILISVVWTLQIRDFVVSFGGSGRWINALCRVGRYQDHDIKIMIWSSKFTALGHAIYGVYSNIDYLCSARDVMPEALSWSWVEYQQLYSAPSDTWKHPIIFAQCTGETYVPAPNARGRTGVQTIITYHNHHHNLITIQDDRSS